MNQKRGYTLITTMMIMVVLFVIGAAGALLAYYGDMTSGAMTNFTKAYYNADYGIREAMYNANNYYCNCQNNGCGFSETLPTGGTVKVITNTDQAGRTCFIESIGTGQTGGYVARVASVVGNTSNWGAFGFINGNNLYFNGSASINGCDIQDNCKAAGMVEHNLNLVNIYLPFLTCFNYNKNNPKGIIGNPSYTTTGATDIAQLITPFSSFTNLVNYIQNMACPPDGSSCLTSPQTPSNPNCYCNGSAVVNGDTISCGNNNISLSQCSTYYATGSISANNGISLNNQTIYAGNGINIDGNLTMNNSKIIALGSVNFNSVVANMTNSQLYIGGNNNVAFDKGSTLQGSTVYVQNGSVFFNSGSVDLCGNQPCTSTTDSIVFAGGSNGQVYEDSPINGGLIYGNQVTIQPNGNTTIGNPSQEPTMTIANTINMNMNGDTSYYGIIMANSLGNMNLGNSSINGALYVNNANAYINGNASINFNYSVLNQISQSFPSILNPALCYSGVSSINPLNITTIY